MQIKGRINTKFLGLATLALAGMVFSGTAAFAGVTGTCSICHTMHNSQDGTNEVIIGAGAGWSGDGGSLGGAAPSATGQARLLKTDCVGCHTSTNADTIITISGNDIPIVFNTIAPTTPLAGGNFFWTTQASGDEKGHNVWGIAGVDGTLGVAPGLTAACGSGCHFTFAQDPATQASGVMNGQGGCEGCHTKVGHHNNADTTYRYLSGHGAPVGEVNGGGVIPGPGLPNPYEDADWEFTKSPLDHNFYIRQTPSAWAEYNPMSPSRFCSGCHGLFHAMGSQPFDQVFGGANGGDDNTDDIAGNNPWMRHPTNVNIPNDGEYAAIYGNAYNPDIPVAQDPAGNPATIDSGDQVQCLSCHRAHGSDQPDMLRFNYSSIDAHSGASTAGCFYCHDSKDNP